MLCVGVYFLGDFLLNKYFSVRDDVDEGSTVIEQGRMSLSSSLRLFFQLPWEEQGVCDVELSSE